MNKSHLMITAILVSLFILSFQSPVLARGKRKSGNKLLFQGKSLFKKGNSAIGGGYVSGWAGGYDIRYSYFLFDDMHIQFDYTPIKYDYGWGTASVTYISAAAIFHTDWWQPRRRRQNNGFYFGMGFAQGQAKYKTQCYYSGCRQYEQSYNLGGLYWTGGWEFILKNNLKIQAGYGITGLNIGVDYLL